MKRSLLASCLALLLGAPTIARAAEVVVAQPAPRRTPLALSLDIDTQWRRDPSYRLFSGERGDTNGGLSATWDLRRLARGTLVVGAGWSGGSNHSTPTGAQHATLSVSSPSLSAALRWSPSRWLEPHVRLALDLSHGQLGLTAGEGSAYQGSAWSPGAALGAGLRLRTGAQPLGRGTLGIGVALGIEGGFHLGMPMKFDVTRQRPAGQADLIPAQATPVGDLGRSHPYLRVSLTLLI
jgi:hypothetical protein